MATIARGIVQVAHTISGNSPQIMYHMVGTPTWTGSYVAGYGGGGQTSTGYWMKGALLVVNSTGGLDVLRKGHATGATGVDVSLTRILGFAMENSTGTAANRIPILVANSDTVFVGNLASRTSAATASLALTLHYGGEAAGASCNASRTYVMTVGASAAAAARPMLIVDKYAGDEWGDQYGRVLFQFKASACVMR